MPIAFIDSQSSTANHSSLTKTCDIGAPSPDRVLIIGAGGRSASTASVYSVTVDGVTATLIRARNGGGTNVASLWSIPWPTGTSATIVVTYSVVMVRSAFALHATTGLRVTTAQWEATSTGGSVAPSVFVNDTGIALAFAFNGPNAQRVASAWKPSTAETSATITFSNTTTGPVTVDGGSTLLWQTTLSTASASPSQAIIVGLANVAAPAYASTAATEANDIATATSIAPTTATATAIEASDTAASTAMVLVRAQSAVGEADDLATGSATVLVRANAGMVEESDGVIAAASVVGSTPRRRNLGYFF